MDDPGQVGGEGGIDDAVFGDDGGDEFGGGDVEGGVENRGVRGCDGDAFDSGDFPGFPLFDRDVFTTLSGKVNGAGGSDAVEGDGMGAGSQGQVEGANLVGDIAIGGDAVTTDGDQVDPFGSHDVSRGTIDDQGKGDAELLEFPGSEAGALQAGPGFIDVDENLAAGLVGSANDPESSAVIDSCQGAGVAMIYKGLKLMIIKLQGSRLLQSAMIGITGGDPVGSYII